MKTTTSSALRSAFLDLRIVAAPVMTGRDKTAHMRRSNLPGVLVAFFLGVLIGSSPAFGTITTYTDGDFSNWSYSYNIVPSPGGGTSLAQTLSSGGNPGACVQVLNHLGSVGGWSYVTVFAVNDAITWNPVSNGAISSITVRLDDYNPVLYTGMDFNPLIEQDGKYYRIRSDHGIDMRQHTGWLTVAYATLTAADYGEMDLNDPGAALGASPDFSTSGGAIRFGQCVLNSNVSSPYDVEGRFDNWQLEVTSYGGTPPAIPAPGAAVLVVLGLGCVASVRRRLGL